MGKLKEHCPALVLDLGRVPFIDSRGIATILEYLRDCAEYGGKVCLAALHPDVQPIIETVRLGTVMPIFESVEKAVQEMKSCVAQKEPADPSITEHLNPNSVSD